jgi:hypothetical protein
MRISDNPEHWQDRAEEARAIADGLNDPIAKRTMQEITEGYLRLAERAEARFRCLQSQKSSDYRARAAELFELARKASNPEFATIYKQLSISYQRLAGWAEHVREAVPEIVRDRQKGGNYCKSSACAGRGRLEACTTRNLDASGRVKPIGFSLRVPPAAFVGASAGRQSG